LQFFVQITNSGFCSIQRASENFGLVNITSIIIPLVYLFFLIIMKIIDFSNVEFVFLSSILPILFCIPFLAPKVKSWKLFNFSKINNYIKNGHSFLYLTLAALILSFTDKYLMLYFSNIEQIGFYAVAVGLTAPLVLVGEAIIQISFVEVSGFQNPKLSKMIALSRFRTGQLVITFLGGAVFCLASPFLTIFYGQRYIGSLEPLYWLDFAIIFRALGLFLDNGLQGLGYRHLSFMSSLVGIIVTIVVGYYLIPNAGASGAAKSALAGYASFFFFQLYIWTFKFNTKLSDFWGLNPTTLKEIHFSLKNYFIR
jgi:O-antigen/teichoic acid export membrane protein